MGSRTIFPSGNNWKSQRFDSSGSFSVPTNIFGGIGYVSGVGPGGGGCSGGSGWDSGTGSYPLGYASGGSGGMSCDRVSVALTAGESITVTIGAAGTGGASVNRTTFGTTNGNAGTDGTASTLHRGSALILYLSPGIGADFATGGRGVAENVQDMAGVSLGGDGGDFGTAPQAVGVHRPGTDGTNDSLAVGGHGGGASGAGKGGTGGNGDIAVAADATGTAGADGGYGGGGGGGGASSVNSGTTETSTSGAGGDGGDSFLVIEWLELSS